ncbi:hypothetical protein CAPTEDRAFT_169132 [Capitella teleta]|uniref:Uncharacterized protein n=1 Tax=Capitella teleta TaxID=283909 RepID=R7VDE3_CAPTE|nr:hypothetical protein CAPTEDRAFT_169132 [Capitella teleta]|eukprot:ELU13670.1 hypothetical protein CAPTEDRAFT_169132 [Capitella teleta]
MADAGQVVKGGFLRAIGVFFEYDTPKIVHIRSKKVGVINRLIQIVILTYIIGYAIVYQKGYQDFENVESAATIKVKGVLYPDSKKLNVSIPGVTDRIWDAADYVVPPQENDAFFVTTNVVFTRQEQGSCSEDPTMPDVICNSTKDCPAGESVVNGNGVRTGQCTNFNETLKTCEIYAWCPVENDTLPLKDKALLEDSKKFTVLIKNNIEFPKFKVQRRNILDDQDPEYLQSCRYNSKSETDRLCPIFELGVIVSEAGQHYSKVAVKGGVFAININWKCDLDHSIDRCLPQYTFSRLDREEAKIAKGWNFRYANYYEEAGNSTRDLIKAYGLRFVIKVTGEAGKFSVVPLLLNLGSGLGLLAIATVLCDLVVLYILKKGPFYQDKKYLNVVDEDAFHGFVEVLDSDVEDNRSEQSGILNSGSQGHQRSYDATSQSTPQTDEDSSVKNRRPGQYARLDAD